MAAFFVLTQVPKPAPARSRTTRSRQAAASSPSPPLSAALVDLPFTLVDLLGDRRVVDADGALIPLAR